MKERFLRLSYDLKFQVQTLYLFLFFEPFSENSEYSTGQES